MQVRFLCRFVLGKGTSPAWFAVLVVDMHCARFTGNAKAEMNASFSVHGCKTFLVFRISKYCI